MPDRCVGAHRIYLNSADVLVDVQHGVRRRIHERLHFHDFEYLPGLDAGAAPDVYDYVAAVERGYVPRELRR